MDHDHSLLFGMPSIGTASSVVVGRTPQIAVLAQAVLGVGIEKRVPPVGLEQPLDIARGGDAGGERAFAGEFEAFLTVGAGQPQYAETGAHRLLGMLARAEQTVDIEPAPAKAGVPMASARSWWCGAPWRRCADDWRPARLGGSGPRRRPSAGARRHAGQAPR